MCTVNKSNCNRLDVPLPLPPPSLLSPSVMSANFAYHHLTMYKTNFLPDKNNNIDVWLWGRSSVTPASLRSRKEIIHNDIVEEDSVIDDDDGIAWMTRVRLIKPSPTPCHIPLVSMYSRLVAAQTERSTQSLVYLLACTHIGWHNTNARARVQKERINGIGFAFTQPYIISSTNPHPPQTLEPTRVRACLALGRWTKDETRDELRSVPGTDGWRSECVDHNWILCRKFITWH